MPLSASILIELFNQIARRNFIKHQARRPMRERTAEAIMRLMGQQRTPQTDDAVALPRMKPLRRKSAI